MLINIVVHVQAYMSNTFELCLNKLKIANLNWVKGNNSNKTEKIHMQKSQVHCFKLMLIIIPAKTPKTWNRSTKKYPGAQLHMLNNIPDRFHDSRSNSFLSYVRRKLKIFFTSRAITLKILNISAWKYPG
jgi:hypothetical protein